MSYLDVHEDDCIRLLGKPYSEVHVYLDELADIFPVNKWGAWHRRYRHNMKGVKYCLHKWGEMAEMAAKIHIVRGWYVYIDNYNLVEILELADKLLPKLHIEKGGD